MSTIQVNAIQSSSGTQEVTQTTLFSGTAKAWSNLNGTGTIAERDSFNISSISDLGVGHYTVNLTASMDNSNYSGNSNGDNNAGDAPFPKELTTLAVGSFEVFYYGGSVYDPSYACIQIWGDLA